MKTILASGLLIVAALLASAASSLAQKADAPVGVISGTVTADKGAVHAIRVKARDTVRHVAYTVFTNKGKYQIFNLPPGTYQVTAPQEGFESTNQTVELKAGETKSADLALRAKETKQDIELVDYDTLFPPGPGRDLLMKECAGCHGLEHIPWQKLAGRNEEAWRRGVDRMFEIPPNRPVPIVSPDAVSVEQRETIIKYFVANFGEGSKRRDLKLDQLPLDEDALSQAIWIEYELPPPGKMANGQTVARRGTHDIYPSETSSKIWLVDTNTGSILSMDPHNLDYQERFKEYLLPSPTKYSVHPHGIIENRGHVYWTELDNSSVGELDPKTGEVHQYATPTKGAPHTLRADSKGNIWFSSLYNNSKIGMLDAKTKKVVEWDPSPSYKNAHYYGMTVDKKDRVWAVGMTAHMIVGYDPRTEKWTTYKTPTQPSGPRRPSVAPDGMIWFSENIGDAIGMLDPDTGKITEYKSPFHYAGEYECFADPSGGIWVTLLAYETVAKFDTKTKTYTYYPHPVPRGTGGRAPKLETSADDTVWMALGTNVWNLRPKGNVPTRQTAAMQSAH